MATATTPGRPLFPPFTRDNAMQKVRLAEEAWISFGIRDRFTMEEQIGVH